MNRDTVASPEALALGAKHGSLLTILGMSWPVLSKT